jgi:ribosome-binding protein aMBF1 (putative translation factor)
VADQQWRPVELADATCDRCGDQAQSPEVFWTDSRLTVCDSCHRRSSPISTRMPSVVVEYDRYGQRAIKRFDDAYEARRFYALKLSQGKNPQVRK